MLLSLTGTFLTYTLITAFTPGPNNILILSSVTQYGLRRSLGVLAGICLGFLIVMLLCAVMTVTIIHLIPAIADWLKWAGSAWILWLSWRIANSTPTGSGASSRPLSLWTGFALQFANVKIILYGITALSTFVIPYTQSIGWLGGIAVVLAVIGWLGTGCWALAGHVLQSVFQRYFRAINIILALLLAWCALKMLMQ
ncbi:cysteine/O-acetylserine transporter [Entomohabitans teleogrylli]|uniref:cysteine/O-acetylserine transporter n=1 Tax=Entomohabitans teleogrylli TaxID=1384589 RepID=UPI000ACDA873|nr:cysteine/O-acetylserine transporter [Entomohabitans teleogrylli]